MRVDGKDGAYVALSAADQGNAKTKPCVWTLLGWGRSVPYSGLKPH